MHVQSNPAGRLNPTLRARRVGWRFALAAVALLTIVLAGNQALAAPSPTQRMDLKVLVVAANGSEPGLAAWQQELRREGVPFTTVIAETAAPITPAMLADGTTRARYAAVIYADDLAPQALAPEERAAIQAFELAFGVRQIDTFVFPSTEEGLAYAGNAGPMRDLGSESTLTAAGRVAFPYLAGRVSFEPSTWGFTALPVAGATVTTLVPAIDSTPLVGVTTWPDGRNEMFSTVAVGPDMINGSLLLRGMLRWATEGVGVGMWRSYFAAHIDDIFLGDDRWDTVANVTHEDDGATLPMIRMTPADVTRAATWSQSSGIKLDFVYNGAGMDDAIAENGSDALSAALLQAKSRFRWVNHTYTHLNLDSVSTAAIVDEIRQNTRFASRNGLPIRSGELVTGEHSGLANPNLPAALAQTGIQWIGADNSRQPDQYKLGSATTVPRHPANIYYNVGTFAEQLDEYNYVYYEGCVQTAVTTCLTQPATWQQYVDSETAIMLRHLLGNDPRPHYMHQANLAEDGTFYPIVDATLSRYRSYFTAPLVNPTMTDAGRELARQKAWVAAMASGAVTAYRLGSNVVVSNTMSTSIDIPLSGVGSTASYGGTRSQWVTVGARNTVSIKINTTP